MKPVDRVLVWQQLFNLISNLSTDSIPDLKVSVSLAIELFESQIITRSVDDLADPIAGKMRSYTTETHRLLRLLPMDVMFIAAARNPTTRLQRLQAYQEKLDLLRQYCQVVVDSGSNSKFKTN
jgi:hypothetical protein